MKIDFSKLEKIAEFRNGELQWLEGRDINAVYVILVGDEYYIGSSHYTYLRIGQHLGELEHGHHHSQKLQDKFNEVGEFDVYSLDRGVEKAKLKVIEFQYIKKYKPTLNVIVPKEDGYQKKLTFSERIKYLIQEKGWTLEKVGELMTNKNGGKGVSQSSVSQMINGNPTIDKLQEIASIIGISVSELVAEEHEQVENTLTCPKCGARFKLEE